MIKLILQILGVIFLIVIFQWVRAYVTTKSGECKDLGISYFPLSTFKVCKGDVKIPVNTNTISTTTSTHMSA